MITAGVHLYGSQRGYRTIARSADVTSAEDAGLAGIGFGQANAPSMLASLNSAPTALGRILASGRFAMTRALPGSPDDAGRPTIVLCTLIFTADDYVSVVRHHLERLVAERSLWDADRLETGDRVTLRLPAGAQRAATEADLRVADAWLQSQGRSDTLAVLPNGSETDLLALPQVLAAEDALRLRWGIRLLGVDAGAEVGTLVQGAATGRRRTLPCSVSGPYRSQWLSFLASRGDWSTPLVLHQGRTEVEESSAPAAASGTQPTRPTRRRSPLALGALVGVAIALAAAVVVIAVTAPWSSTRVGNAGHPMSASDAPMASRSGAPPSAPESHGAPAPVAPDASAATTQTQTPTSAGTETTTPSAPEGRVRTFGDDAPRRAGRLPADEQGSSPPASPTVTPADPPSPPKVFTPGTPASSRPSAPAAPTAGSPDQRVQSLLKTLPRMPPERHFEEFNRLDRAEVQLLFARVAGDLNQCAVDGAWHPIEMSPAARERLESIRREAQDRARIASSGAAWIAAIIDRRGTGPEVAPELSVIWGQSGASSGERWESLQDVETTRDTLQMLTTVSAKILEADAAIGRMRNQRTMDTVDRDVDQLSDASRKAVQRCAREVDDRLPRWTRRAAVLLKKAAQNDSAPSAAPDG